MNKALLFFVMGFFMLVPVSAGENNLFPDIPGWKMKVDDRVFNSGDLWEIIDGAADIFLSYYFQDLHIAEYTKKDQVIRVEIYRHKTTEDAYGIYTAERMPDYPQVSIGSQGYKSQGVMNFLAGYYYVKVMSAGVEEADEQSIAIVAGKVEENLAQPKSLPGIISLLPEDGRVYLSDTYIAQNFLGYSFFRNAFTALYEKPADFQLFIIKLPPDEIQKMLDQYIQMMKDEKIQRKEDLIIVSDMFNGTVFLKQKDEYLIGVLNTTNQEAAVKSINMVLTRIQ